MGNKNSGPAPTELRIWCETQLREVALPKMVAYLKKNRISAKDWHWCYDQLVRLGQVAAGAGEDAKTPQEKALELLA